MDHVRSRGLHHDARAPPVVGRYAVDIPSFETCVLPILTDSSSNPQVTVLDEIGKMELFSRPFATAVKKIFDQSSSVVLATVPLSKGRGLPLVEEIKKRPDCALTEVKIYLTITIKTYTMYNTIIITIILYILLGYSV